MTVSQAKPEQNGAPAEESASNGASSTIELSFSLEEARVLRSIAQRGMLAAGAEGAPNGQPQQANAAIKKLASALEEAEMAAAVRTELEKAGLETRRLSDAQVWSLGRRLAEIPQRPQPQQQPAQA
jgi:hypothetical protein